MHSDVGDEEKKPFEVAESGSVNRLERAALITRDSRVCFTVAALRGMVPTFAVESLAELRAALSVCFEERWEAQQSEPKGSSTKLFALDITRIPLADTALLGQSLSGATALGAVYVVTPEQFELFEEGTFDFVIR